MDHEEPAMDPDASVTSPAAATTIPEFVRAIGGAYGTKVAVTADDDTITYAEIERSSGSLARGLPARGGGKGTPGGAPPATHPRWAVAWPAICRIGAVCVPLSTLS